MNNIKEARELVFDKNNHIYLVTLHKKFLGGYYYEIKYRDKYSVDRLKVFNSTHKTKEECLIVLKALASLSGECFKIVDNVVINFENISNIQHNDALTTSIIYDDGNQDCIHMNKKQFTKLYCEFLNYKDKNMCR